MGSLINLFKITILSIVEGVTEFLPISSTGHLILVNEFVKLEPETFANAFNVIIQLGAILSVIILYRDRLNPWSASKIAHKRPGRYEHWNWQTKAYFNINHADERTMKLWLKVLIACIPGGVLGLLFDDYIDANFTNMPVVTATLLIYGVIIVALEKWNGKRKRFLINTTEELDYRRAFLIGCFQSLALIPGTSRSAATILGAMLLGTGRVAAAEFSFFLAIPTMVGATLLKVLKNLGVFTGMQWLMILIGFVLSFIVAYIVIKKFMDYIKKNDFTLFGYYRIGLSAILIIYMLLTM